MKLTIAQSVLTANLNLVSRAVSSRPSHPVLANILLDADEELQQIKLSAFDLSLGIQVSLGAQIEEGGKLTLPAKLLTDIVSRLTDGNLAIESDPETFSTTISSTSGKYEVRGMSADEFPELPEVENGQTVLLSPTALIEGLRSTLFSASTDETKSVLTGVHLTQKADSLEFASTTGHVLTVFNAIADPDDAFDVEKALEATVPAKALQELAKMLEKSENAVEVSFDSSQIIFEMGDHRLTSRLLEGQYPNYQQLIPRQFARQITAERRLLLSALERVAVVADLKNNIAKLTLDSANQQIILSVDTQDVGSARETIPAQITGDDLDVAFNVKYLMDGLKAISTTEIQMQLNTATSPAIVTPLGGAKMIYLAMPVQIRS